MAPKLAEHAALPLPGRRGACLGALAVFALTEAAAAAPPRADDDDVAAPAPVAAPTPPPPHRYFYHGRDYGNESLYGPIYVLLNRGYDVLQVRPGARNIFHQAYGEDGKVVLRNLANPFPAIADDGYGRFFRTEILPLSFTPDTAYWVPNYSLHLIGGGMTFRALSEWFDDHRFPVPWLWSGATIMGSALVNETLENKRNTGFNTDAIADVYFFDVGGMLLFSIDGVARFFSEDVRIMDWSLQPTFTFPGGNLNNAGNYFAVKWPLPFYPRLSPLVHIGLGWLGGLSYRVSGEYSVSVGLGARSYRLMNFSISDLRNKVSFAPSAGVFIDRNDSLVASFRLTNVEDYFGEVEVFPNSFWHENPGIGFWYTVGKHGEFLTGLTVTKTLEFGVGYERPVHGSRSP
ncbi:MAG TPA: hypothetical protein VHE30_21265 [Polyangiaceae bacterium]|nr:hypothetical protein [Polyangiaceae bacterium]